MHHTHIHHRGPVAATILMLLACLGLAACGGSSSSSSTTTTVAANSAPTSTAPGGGTPGAPGGRFAAMRACLAKAGITLPQRIPGQRRTPGAGGFLGGGGAGGPQLPKGVTRAQFAAALKKCGGGVALGRRGRFNQPAFRQVLTAFAACMRQHSVHLPSPNSSGTGPVFNTKGVNIASAQFKAAETKCQSILRSAIPRRPSAGGAGASRGGT